MIEITTETHQTIDTSLSLENNKANAPPHIEVHAPLHIEANAPLPIRSVSLGMRVGRSPPF